MKALVSVPADVRPFLDPRVGASGLAAVSGFNNPYSGKVGVKGAYQRVGNKLELLFDWNRRQ
jgi:hypothetical protein